MAGERKPLTTEEAIQMIPEGEFVHTFRQGSSGMLIGADWGRADLIAEIKKWGCELAGDTARLLNHGLALRDDLGCLFIQTKEE